LIINTNPSVVSDLSFTATGHNKQEPKHTIGVVGACSPHPLALYFTAKSHFSSLFINVDEKKSITNFYALLFLLFSQMQQAFVSSLLLNSKQRLRLAQLIEVHMTKEHS
jgi:hypothetical protein